MFQMYQMLPSLSNVYVSNVTANVNVHAPYVQPIPAPYGHQIPPQQQQPPQQVYTHGPPEGGDQGNRNRRQRQKTDKKREGPYVQTSEVISPSLDGHPPPQFPNIPAIPPYYLPGAPGAPVYMQHAILPVYPSPMFGPYSHTPGPMVYPQANNIDPANEEYHDNVQQNFHQGGSEMVVVGCPDRSENASDQRRGIEGSENNYQIELQEHVIQDPSGYKPGSESAQFHGENVDGQGDQPFLSQQNGESFENFSKEDLGGNYYERKNSEIDQKMEGSKQVTSEEQTTQFSSTLKEDATNFQTESVGQISTQKKKTNGEFDVNTVDKVSVNSNSSAAAWENEEGRHSTVLQSDVNNIKLINGNSAQVVKVQEISQQSREFPLIGQNVKVTRSTLASPGPEVGVSNQVTPSSVGKSWASLFNRSEQFSLNSVSDNRGRPLARVLPYHEVESSSLSAPIPPLPPVPSSGVKMEGVASIKVNGPNSHESVTTSNFLSDPYLYNLGGKIFKLKSKILQIYSITFQICILAVFLCKYELEHKIVSLQPRGLTNRSNWCYVNAVLQSLIACPPFYNLLKALPVGVNKKGNKQTLIVDALSVYCAFSLTLLVSSMKILKIIFSYRVEYANEFSPLPPNARSGKRDKSARNKEENTAVEIMTGPAFEPSGIYKILGKVRGESSFNVEGRQEDAEEFLSCLLNGLNDEMFEVWRQ